MPDATFDNTDRSLHPTHTSLLAPGADRLRASDGVRASEEAPGHYVHADRKWCGYPENAGRVGAGGHCGLLDILGFP
jgi:hypothetical protein